MRRANSLAALLLALAPAARAADAPRVVVASARVGLPAAHADGAPVAKFAAWAPVYVELRVLESVGEPAELVVESPDADGVTTSLAVPLDLSGAKTVTALAYVRPAAGAADTTVTVRVKGVAVSDPFRVRDLRPRDPLTYVVLGLGSRLPGFDLPRPAGSEGDTPPGAALRGGRVELTALADFDLLPDHAIGYDAADLVVLTTSTGDVFEKLFAPGGEKKRAALLDWVRRGGRLVVSAGAKAELLARAPADFLPAGVKATPTRAVARLPLYWSARESSQTSTLTGTLAARGAEFPVAQLAPAGGARVLIPPPSRQADDADVIAVQAGYGLGRVTVVAFDLDRPPYTEFASRAEFWDWVLREGGASRASVGSEGKPRPVGAGPTDDEDELAVALRTHVDTYDGVPVIPFGWVAFLIAGYLLLIGPVEYYVLKRILGRLELTWLTFPLIVLTVAGLAAAGAAGVKGRDLRVNAVEVVDVVPNPRGGGGSVFGTVWFGAFSPKGDAYAVGVSPAAGWAAGGADGDPVLGWVGGPRGGRASLLRRRYEVRTGPDGVADALAGVPIPMWATKSFAASWAAPLDPAAPAVESRLEHPPGDPAKAVGTFVSRMPFPELTDAVAFYAGQAYPLGTLVPDQEVRLTLDRGQAAGQYLQDKGGLADLLARTPTAIGAPAARTGPAGTAAPPPVAADGLPLLGLLFHEAALRNDEGVVPRNASVRRLDQSWRLSAENRGEVIVVARAPVTGGRTADLTGGTSAASRVWLRALPGSGPRPPLPGVGRTETYVRVYLPVK